MYFYYEDSLTRQLERLRDSELELSNAKERAKKEKKKLRRKEKNAFINSKEWRATREVVLERDEHVCVYCGKAVKGANLHVDHILPKSKYPELALNLDNLQILCKECNFKKCTRIVDNEELKCLGCG